MPFYFEIPFSEKTHICTRSYEPDEGPVLGDFGGPLICNNSVVGISSFSFAEKYHFSPYIYTVYTVIHDKMEWLTTTMSNNKYKGNVPTFLPIMVDFWDESIYKNNNEKNLEKINGSDYENSSDEEMIEKEIDSISKYSAEESVSPFIYTTFSVILDEMDLLIKAISDSDEIVSTNIPLQLYFWDDKNQTDSSNSSSEIRDFVPRRMIPIKSIKRPKISFLPVENTVMPKYEELRKRLDSLISKKIIVKFRFNLQLTKSL